MSKNVAVFVDVANIFYAAKAAGVDIDYVTLLKSATAGRDLVRAYAYTGLDPENENQRQFHAFLARSGFKVVSKDIRKYGDGRVKANLDIELVVDLMRMAEKLDIAVVISGDGDFAPAIYAVQQQGVRVEVISFRGNTSSDLIEAADVFIDIASVAKVEKGLRSGRRVASDGDLSMTEVPDKESGVIPRRRRRDTEERPERAERGARRRGIREPVRAAEEAPGEGQDLPVAGLVVLPGEKLSRGSARPASVAEPVAAVETDGAGGTEMPGESSEEGRRRRRRRGGRGRGRGGRGPEATEAVTAGEPALDELEGELPEFADEVPPLPQHAGFGSVWDSQIGMPTDRRGIPPARHADELELEVEGLEGEAEPDVPEYLLAERRQQDRRQGGRGGRGGRGGGYRSAIDRERFGVSRSGYQRPPGRPGKGPRPAPQGRASAQAMEPIEQTPGGDPWSEVPPDVQELLRAELARRQGAAARPSRPAAAAPPAETADAAVTAPAEDAAPAKPKRTTRKRTSSTTTEAADAAVAAPAEDAAPAKPKRTTRKRTSSTTAEAADAAGEA